MSDYDSDEDTQPKKRKIKETRIPNGLENGPVKHKKMKNTEINGPLHVQSFSKEFYHKFLHLSHSTNPRF
jgi:hypothetical protein